ncbi:MAG: mannonate dehydratase [Tenuifilaceae bacterium]|jgi:mannonate dehydratase|nr:mannonate dehydratase [Tenuifilaceae bacterium]
MALEKTWRWFGFNDPITLDHLAQIGVEGVVTALHHIPNGEVWPKEEILKVKQTIEAKGLRWSVVESLPVSEGIKLKSDNYDRLISNYQVSLRNLGECGIDTVVYNFMPVIDWVRTNLNYSLSRGGESMYFDFPTFAAFDIYLLKRPEAEKDYDTQMLAKAKSIANKLTPDEADTLVYNIIVLTQGFINGAIDGSESNPKELFLEFIARYKDTNRDTLRQNLKDFLNNVIPVAEEVGVNLCIHPDDPPFPVLGLPRIVSSIDDLAWILNANTSTNNGLAYCVGSLSARADNNLVEIAQQFGPRIHFAHLRNTQLLPDGSFYESGHIAGSQNMVDIVAELLKEQKRRVDSGRKDFRMPFRPDHGIKMLHDYDQKYNPGYPLIGRLKGLAEIEGLMAGIERFMQSKK